MIRISFLLPLAVTVVVAGSSAAMAQSVGPDEAIQANGAMSPKVALTAAQERTIYNAVLRQRVRASTAPVPAVIGAAVPNAVELGELPDQAATDIPWATFKYAMVEDDIVVVDPVMMRVVDVIHGAGP